MSEPEKQRPESLWVALYWEILQLKGAAEDWRGDISELRDAWEAVERAHDAWIAAGGIDPLTNEGTEDGG